MEWITNKRPEKEGTYLVTIEYEMGKYDSVTDKFESDGKLYRDVDARYYAKPGEFVSWAMVGENPNDYHWTEQTGSLMNERVVGWLPTPPYDGNLKPGVTYVIGDSGSDETSEDDFSDMETTPASHRLLFAFPIVDELIGYDQYGHPAIYQAVDGFEVKDHLPFVNGEPVFPVFLGSFPNEGDTLTIGQKVTAAAISWVKKQGEFTKYYFNDPDYTQREYEMKYGIQPFDFEFGIRASKDDAPYTIRDFSFGVIVETDGEPINEPIEKHAMKLLAVHKRDPLLDKEWWHLWEGDVEE